MTPFAPESVRVPRSLPRGRHALPRNVVLVSQYERLLEGIVQAVSEKGYAGATVADVTARAGVSRGTFYEHFTDKEDCFLAAFKAGSRIHYDHVVAGFGQSPDWQDDYRAGVRAYLQVLAESPHWSRTFLVEVFAAGRAAMALRRKTHQRYVELIKAFHKRWREELPELPVLPDEIYEAAIVAVNDIVVMWIERGDAHRLSELEATITYIHLALLGLGEHALPALATNGSPVPVGAAPHPSTRGRPSVGRDVAAPTLSSLPGAAGD